MFANDSESCFGKNCQQEESMVRLLFLFPAEVMECLLHGLPKLLPERSWIEAEEFPIESRNHVSVKRHSCSSVSIKAGWDGERKTFMAELSKFAPESSHLVPDGVPV